MTLGIAVLNLLSRAAARQPLLLALDDAQWLDDASADVCGFVGRRLAGSPVKLLAAARSDVPSRFDTAAWAELPVAALSEADAGVLLDRRHPELPRAVRRVVLEQAQGNPLALLELPAQFAGRSGELLDDPFGQHTGQPGVPLPRRLQHLYGARIQALSDPVRAELLKGALDGAARGPTTGPPRGALPDAGRRRGGGRRAAGHRSGRRRVRVPASAGALHDRAAGHAEPAPGRAPGAGPGAPGAPGAPRDASGGGRRRPRRGGRRRAGGRGRVGDAARRRAGAVAWLTRAAELSEHHADRSRRLADAAFIASNAGRLGQAHRLVLADLASGTTESPAAVLAAAYQALYQDGDVRSTHRLVAAAVEKVRDSGATEPDEVVARLVDLLLGLSSFAGEEGPWDRARELLDSLGGLVTDGSRLYSDVWSDVVRHGLGRTEPVADAVAKLPDLEPWDVTRLGITAHHLDMLSQYRPHLQRVVDRELETGAVASGLVMLHLIMLDQMAAGEWADAEQTGERVLGLAVEHGLELFAAQSRAYLAQVAALRGQLARARDLQAETEAWARPRGLGLLTQTADAAGASAALSAGDYEAAYLYAIGVTAPGTFQPYAHQAPRMLLDLVEAALHTGRAEEARRHAQAALDAGLPAISPRLAVVTYGALAMTAETEREAAEMFALVEAHPDAARFPFEVARIRLAHGTRVRHVEGRAAARQYLLPAAEAFERLGAAGWTERAQSELRATGAAPRASTLHLATLTWQERRIADLAASGLTNKEIGTRMHLSPRTVSSHLYRIFPKLNITTRAALRDALSRSEEAVGVGVGVGAGVLV
ncbi:LuxR C-terminal-related transcriptional regulator [Catenulispora yoronensis]